MDWVFRVFTYKRSSCVVYRIDMQWDANKLPGAESGRSPQAVMYLLESL